MNLTTRQLILELLQSHPNITATEMSHRLRVTRADIRYHLNSLVEQNLVIRMDQPEKKGKRSAGRPASTFQLSPQSRPDMVPMLAGALLDIIKTSGNYNLKLAELAIRLSSTTPVEPSQTSFPQRLNQAIEILNRNPYQARWEAHNTGPQVIFHNCPFASVIQEHPELCRVDQLVLSNLTGMRAGQIKKIHFSGPSSPVCQFILAAAPLES